MVETPLAVTILLLWLLASLFLAPLEALGWYAGWIEGDEDENPEPEPEDKPIQPEKISRYIVFMSGISGVSGEVFLPEERLFLDKLDARLDDMVVVDDLYPYSVSNQALTGQRVFAWFWRIALKAKLSGDPLRRFIGFLINLRNTFQVMVSADRRYGPIYNSGTARMIVKHLLKAGYVRGSGMPVTLLGYSGGGQISLGAAPYLREMIGAPVNMVSLGGAMGDDPGVMSIEHLYHLQGNRDGVQRLGLILSPGRWRIGNIEFLPNSYWHRARKKGIISIVAMGEMKHNGRMGYLDAETMDVSGKSYLDITIDEIANILKRV